MGSGDVGKFVASRVKESKGETIPVKPGQPYTSVHIPATFVGHNVTPATAKRVLAYFDAALSREIERETLRRVPEGGWKEGEWGPFWQSMEDRRLVLAVLSEILDRFPPGAVLAKVAKEDK